MKLTNLYEETMDILKRNGKSEYDIIIVFNRNGIMDKERFLNLAKNFDYDPGYGTAYVDQSLTILLPDGRMEREEYDGAECWRYISYSTMIPPGRSFDDLYDNDYARKEAQKIEENSKSPEDIFERFKAGETLSTEDLVALQKSGYL